MTSDVKAQAPTYWVNIPERANWLVINFEGRKLGMILTVAESGQAFLTIAGYHNGDSRFVGEKQNIMSVKVEPIPKDLHNSFMVLARNALPAELKALPIAFL